MFPSRIFLACVVTLALGCGDDDGMTPDSGMPDTGMSDAFDPDTNDPDAMVMGVDISFVVESMGVPQEGFAVAFDASNGERSEAVTGADGRVTFTDVIWDGDASVTWGKEGELMASFTRLSTTTAPAITNDAGDIELRVVNLPDTDDRVTVTGTFTNVTDPDNLINVIANVPGATAYNGPGPDYEIEVPRGVPFRLFGLEFSAERPSSQVISQTFPGAQTMESDALEEDAVIDFDLSTSLPYSETTGSIPTADGVLQDGLMYGIVSTRESMLSTLQGALTETMPMDGTLNFTVGAFDVPDTNPVTVIFAQRSRFTARIVVDGLASGSFPALPTPPTVVVPSEGTAHDLYGGFTMGELDSGLHAVVQLVEAGIERPLWATINLVAGDSTVTVPEPPSGFVVSEWVPADGEVSAQFIACGFDEYPGLCDQFALGERAFDLVY